MPDGTCSVATCDRPVETRGMCNPHYQMQYRGKDPHAVPVPQPPRTCTVAGCDKSDRFIAGYCNSHYYYWKRTGEIPMHLIKRGQLSTCIVDGCDRSTRGGGLDMCGAHYQRHRIKGDAGGADIEEHADQEPTCRLCGEPSKALSLCNKHYRRQYEGKDPEVDPVRTRKSIDDRFWPRVDKNGPVPPHCPELGQCWVWTGTAPGFGYGIMGIGGKNTGTHRISWEIHNGPIPDGLWVLHKCDNPPCVHPDHLFLGTAQDNMQDASNKGRASGSRKLGWDEIDQIRADLAAGANRFDLANRFGVTAANIWCIGAGVSWDPAKRRSDHT